MSVLSLPEAKAHLSIKGDAYDAQLTAMIASAEATIAARVGPLEAAARTVRVRANGRALAVDPPAGGLDAVVGASGGSIDVIALHLDPLSGVIRYNDDSSFGATWYDVTYSYGRETCPADLLLAVKEMVRHLWDTQRGPGRRPGSTTSDATSNTIPGAGYLLPFRVSELIAPHLQTGFA
jgi:hypothetical protein